MLMLLRLLVTAFDVFALGTAIYSTSLNYYYRCIGQIYRKPACYVNILNENICFVKAFFDKKSNFVKKNGRKWLPVADASVRRRLITALHAHCALKLSTYAAIAACAMRVSPPAAPLPRAFFTASISFNLLARP